MIDGEESGAMEISCGKSLMPVESQIRKHARRLYRQLAAGQDKQRIVRGKMRIAGREVHYFASYDRFQNRANKCVFTEDACELERLDKTLDAGRDAEHKAIPGGIYNTATQQGTWHIVPSDAVGTALCKTHQPQIMREASILVRWMEKNCEMPFGVRIDEVVINLQEVHLIVLWTRDTPPYMVNVCGSKERAETVAKAFGKMMEMELGIPAVHMRDEPQANN